MATSPLCFLVSVLFAYPFFLVSLSRCFDLWGVRYPVWQHTFVSPSAFSRRAVVSYWRKYVHEVLVNRLGGLSLPRKSVVRLTGRPEMTLDVYRGRKTTKQQQLTFGKENSEFRSLSYRNHFTSPLPQPLSIRH